MLSYEMENLKFSFLKTENDVMFLGGLELYSMCFNSMILLFLIRIRMGNAIFDPISYILRKYCVNKYIVE